jgi:CRISPR-associated endonuclease/helicase Cas3
MVNKKRALDFGRVFFPNKDENGFPEELKFQPLGNHVANVRKLVTLWKKTDFGDFDPEASRKRVARAAQLHDIGKPQKFSMKCEKNKQGKINLIYSFRGHRFLASDLQRPWVESLAKGHHDYSIHDIARDTYHLKTLVHKTELTDPQYKEVEQYKKVLEHDSLAYARELYILEMCDQIEAEIACRFYDDDKQAETRAFMDFNIERIDKQIFELDPWVFNEELDEIELSFSCWSMPFPDEVRQEWLKQNKKDSNRDIKVSKRLNDVVKDWWKSHPSIPKSAVSKIIIKKHSSENFSSLDSLSTYEKLSNFKPNQMQEALLDSIEGQVLPPAILLQSPTGSGKTEAVLFPALANDYRLFVVLPTRSLIEDQSQRIEKYLIKFSGLEENQNREFSMVIDTGAEMKRVIYINGNARTPSNNPRRHLFKGNVILTTLDKFLYRYFAYGDKQKSFVFPHRIQQEKTLICFDEAHSYDDIAFTNFQSLVKSLYEAGRALILMTATMPKELVKTFEYLDILDYSNLSRNCPRGLKYLHDVPLFKEEEGIKDFSSFQETIKQLTLHERASNSFHGILVVVETVRDAVEIYRQLKDDLPRQQDKESLFLYHGRIADQLRPQIYARIKEKDEHSQPYILVTTSAIEVGCDLNAGILITQICPPENLIQRAGRCNRRGDIANAKILVVGDHIPDFANTLNEEAWATYHQTLLKLTEFDTTEIAECITRTQKVDDYRVVEIFSMLHDYVYGADLTCQPTHERGLIPTRSWKPSVTLKFEGYCEITKKNFTHSTTISIDRFCSGKEFAYVDVFQKYYDQETTSWINKPLMWGSVYEKDITISIANERDNFIFDHSNSKYSYDPELGFVEIPKVFIKLKSPDLDQKLLYQNKNLTEKKSIIISYVKDLSEE